MNTNWRTFVIFVQCSCSFMLTMFIMHFKKHFKRNLLNTGLPHRKFLLRRKTNPFEYKVKQIRIFFLFLGLTFHNIHKYGHSGGGHSASGSNRFCTRFCVTNLCFVFLSIQYKSGSQLRAAMEFIQPWHN